MCISPIFDWREELTNRNPALTRLGSAARPWARKCLEESEFEPMFSACKGQLGGKRIALFGSYGWGDGEWMRSWDDAGAALVCDSVICSEAPDDGVKAACKALGTALAE